MVTQKPILITGSHRSGTTWIGKMLSASSEVGYIHEPFGLMHRPGICCAKFQHWFTYVNAENEGDFVKDIDRMLAFDYNPFEEAKAITSFRDGLRLTRDYFLFQKYRLTQARPLIKDPIAFFSSEWFAREFNADVVITIRHPAAFVSGLKVKHWEFEFSNFLDQPLLMKDYLHPFESEIREFARERKPLIDQGILLWKIFYSIIDGFRSSHKNWIFVKHEDLANDPLGQFESLYQQLGIKFSSKEKAFIESYSTPKNPSKSPSSKKIFGSNVELSVKRSSQSSIKNWQARLTPPEIEKIRTHTSSIADKFYSQDGW